MAFSFHLDTVFQWIIKSLTILVHSWLVIGSFSFCIKLKQYFIEIFRKLKVFHCFFKNTFNSKNRDASPLFFLIIECRKFCSMVLLFRNCTHYKQLLKLSVSDVSFSRLSSWVEGFFYEALPLLSRFLRIYSDFAPLYLLDAWNRQRTRSLSLV